MPEITTTVFIGIFYSFIVIQGIYWLYFLIGLLRTKEITIDSDVEKISVIVAAQDELENLKRLIPALLAQKHPQFEIIIVNDRSDDGTLEFLLEQEKLHTHLRALHVHDRPEHITGKKYALTLGIKAAKYNNILLTDADCYPTSTSWISKMGAGFRNADFVLGFSQYTWKKGFLNKFIRFETLLTGVQYIGAAGNKMPYMGVGRNLGYKKDLFLAHKGYHGFQELIGGDDDLFVNRYAKGRFTTAIIGPEALTESDPKTTWSSYFKQKHRHLRIGKHYSLGSKLAIGFFNLSWILAWLLAAAGLFAGLPISFVVGGLVLREIFMLTCMILGTKRFGITYHWLGVMLLDLIYPFYYIFTGTKALFVKTVSWE